MASGNAFEDFRPIVVRDVATGVSVFAADPDAVPNASGPLRDCAIREAAVHRELRRRLGNEYDRALSPSGMERARAAAKRVGMDRVLRAVRAAAEAKGARLLALPRIGFDPAEWAEPDDALLIVWAYWAVTAALFGPDRVPAPSGRYGPAPEFAPGGRARRGRLRARSRGSDVARRALATLRATALAGVVAAG